MAEKKVSLLIVAKDAASAVVRATGTAISKIASSITGAFKIAGKSVSGINQGLELVKKVLGGLRAAYDATIAKALELRGANDPARKDLEALGKAAADLQASIGDALIPVVRAFAQVLTPVIQGAQQWVKANQALIGTRVLEWAVSLARALTSGVATALLLVTRGWYGMRFAVNAVTAVTKAYFANVMSWISSLLGGLSGFASALGQSGLAGDLDTIAAKSARWSAELGTAASKDVDAMLEIGLEMQRTEKTIDSVADAINVGLGQVAVNGVNNLTSSVVKASKSLGNLKGDADGAYQAWLAFNQATAKANLAKGADELSRSIRTTATEYERAAKNAELQDQVLSANAEKAQKAMQPIADLAGDTVRSIGSAFTNVLDDVIEGSKSATEIIGGFFATIGKSLLNSVIGIGVEFVASKIIEQVLGSATRTAAVYGYAAVAAAAAYASSAAIPIVGWAAAPGIAAAAGKGAIQAAAATGGLGMAEGGLLSGGTSGKDSIPIAGMPGELFTPFNEVRRNVREGREPGDSGGPRRGERPATGAGVTVVMPPSWMPDSPANTERRAVSLGRTLARQQRRAPA